MAASSTLLAQNENQTSFNIEGQIAVTTNGSALFINLGGPAIKFVFKKFAIAANFLPSLKFEDDAPRPFVTPLFGVGPQFYFLRDKRFVLSFPCYYNPSKNRWEVSGGIGYVLTKPNKK